MKCKAIEPRGLWRVRECNREAWRDGFCREHHLDGGKPDQTALPALVNGKLPDVFDVLLDDCSAASAHPEKLSAHMASLEHAKAALIRIGYEACEFRDERTMKTVWRFQMPNAGTPPAVPPHI